MLWLLFLSNSFSPMELSRSLSHHIELDVHTSTHTSLLCLFMHASLTENILCQSLFDRFDLHICIRFSGLLWRWLLLWKCIDWIEHKSLTYSNRFSLFREANESQQKRRGQSDGDTVNHIEINSSTYCHIQMLCMLNIKRNNSNGKITYYFIWYSTVHCTFVCSFYFRSLLRCFLHIFYHIIFRLYFLFYNKKIFINVRCFACGSFFIVAVKSTKLR